MGLEKRENVINGSWSYRQGRYNNHNKPVVQVEFDLLKR